jgi:sortase A
MSEQSPQPDRKTRKPRLGIALSNLLIVVGIILFLGIGAFYAYASYKEDALSKRIAAQNAQRQAQETAAAASATASPQSAFIAPQEPMASSPTTTPTPTPALPQPPPTRIVIPKISVDAKIVEVESHQQQIDGEQWLVWDVASWAVGHHKGTANPGEPGNIVLTGHDDIEGQVFRYLENLQPGDQITLYAGDVKHEYVVDFLALVKEKDAPLAERKKNAEYMGPRSEETVTLISCWPFGIDTHRIIVVAKPAGSPHAVPSTTPAPS